MGDGWWSTEASCFITTSITSWTMCLNSSIKSEISSIRIKGKFILTNFDTGNFIQNLFHLKQILEDDNIVKVGVSPQVDANFLAQDYGICVASTFDLRHMAIMCGCRPGGLGELSETVLNVKLDKNWGIRCSDWEIAILSAKQIEYAAKDAHVAIEIFKILAHRLIPEPLFGNKQKHVQKILNDYCFRFLDINYHGSADAEKRQKPKSNGKISDSA